MLLRLTLLLILIPFIVLSQDNSIRFSINTIDDGLSQSSVYTITQDKQGFIWMGTLDGLNRFDGYNFKKFYAEEGNPTSLSSNLIKQIIQDDQGYIWIATDEGLNKFNPRTEEFTQYLHSETNEKTLSSNKIISLIDAGEHLWIGTQDEGLVKLDKESGSAIRFNTQNSDLSNNGIKSLLLDKDKNLWIGTLDGLCRIDTTEKFSVYTNDILNEFSLLDNTVLSLSQDKEGYIWVGTNSGLQKIQSYNDYDLVAQTINISSNNKEIKIQALLTDSQDIIWIGTEKQGLFRLEKNGGRYEIDNFYNSFYLPNSISSNKILSLFEDDAHIIWVGTEKGACRFDRLKQGFYHSFRMPDKPNSLPDNNIWSINEIDNEIWIGTSEGITRSNPLLTKFYTFPNEQFAAKSTNYLNDKRVFAFYKDGIGQYWLGNVDGLFKAFINEDKTEIRLEKFESLLDSLENRNPIVYEIVEYKNKLLVATREGLLVINQNSGENKLYRSDLRNKKSISNNHVRDIIISPKHGIYVATFEGLNKFILDENPRFIQITSNSNEDEPLPNDQILSIWEDQKGFFWLGTYGGGLVKYDPESKKSSAFTKKDGLANNTVYGVVGDDYNCLWLSTNYGLSKFDMIKEEFTNFHKKDGLQSNEFNAGAYAKTENGHLIFGGINGLNIFYPQEIKTNDIPPKVRFTNFYLDDKPYSIGGNSPFSQAVSFTNKIEVSHKENIFTIEFAALHFSDPSENTYTYRLVGQDSHEKHLGTDHKMQFGPLPPGDYELQVWAYNSDGLRSKQPAKLKITVHPPYWKTTWFQVLSVAIALAIAYILYWMRVSSIRKQKESLGRMVAERTFEVRKQKEQIEDQKRLLEEEKEKAERLLHNILPMETAEELKNKGRASARNYRKVTVLFTDFVGFTKIAERMKPTDLVTKLDSYFIQFDKIIERYNLEKIKTIGDAYMAAGGVPVRNKENPIHTVLAALEIQRYMKQAEEFHHSRGEEHWNLRIGINTGAIVAGVIGTKRFAYDIWGNTVNVASRMEEACEPGRINISGKTYALIEPYFEFTYRGKIPAKNKGHVDMYYVDRIKPELSIDGKGLEPSNDFWEYVNLHLFSSINYMKAERYIMKLLEKKLPKTLHYHSIAHTKDVTEAAERLAIMEGIKGEDLFLLQTAATYHDAGFVEQYDANEPVGIRMAQEILPKFGYTEEQIEIVAGLINATKIPHQPQTKLQEIICDADLDYLGRDDFHDIADLLRRELRDHGKINSDRLWDEIQVKFLTQHQYFTKSAIETRQVKKELHIQQIKDRLETHDYKD